MKGAAGAQAQGLDLGPQLAQQGLVGWLLRQRLGQRLFELAQPGAVGSGRGPRRAARRAGCAPR
jgi:hypothetical protein